MNEGFHRKEGKGPKGPGFLGSPQSGAQSLMEASCVEPPRWPPGATRSTQAEHPTAAGVAGWMFTVCSAFLVMS